MSRVKSFSKYIILKILFIGAIGVQTISCSGADGIDGDAGLNGLDGASCEIRKLSGAENDYEIFCDGVSVGYLNNGQDGDPGAKGDKGEDGQSCSVEEDGAYFVMRCGGVEGARWAKAMCGGVAYDPGDKFCVGLALYDKCGGEEYDPSTQFCDSRDNQIYKWVKIGTQTWLAESLNYDADGSVCYDNLESNCDIYGRLYNWNAAMSVCPSGWHLPTSAEWTALTNHVGSNAGTKLKASSGWNSGGNGTDDFGFSALPGGFGSGSSFNGVGYNGYWWSATEYDASLAWFRYVDSYSSDVSNNNNDKSYLFSVRCVKD
ncbi:MAG: fibrobacter succinogenes major paralogous domain-containing protein [Fibromonadaceae bacterium]|jgi:uncharacterized protein (TIGR02145 family)|nr:fibrobacter succinogenes major paralogous domain-containing protein [Fibromonadaceae bacterium]